MTNIDMTIEKGILTIKVDLKRNFGPSSTGKSLIVATTAGNKEIPGSNGAKIGLNIYRPRS